jgi:hypothetical protein
MGENVKSYHEPYPTMFFKYLRSVINNGLINTYHTRFDAKLPPILDILKDGHIYAETNHVHTLRNTKELSTSNYKGPDINLFVFCLPIFNKFNLDGFLV